MGTSPTAELDAEGLKKPKPVHRRLRKTPPSSFECILCPRPTLTNLSNSRLVVARVDGGPFEGPSPSFENRRRGGGPRGPPQHQVRPLKEGNGLASNSRLGPLAPLEVPEARSLRGDTNTPTWVAQLGMMSKHCRIKAASAAPYKRVLSTEEMASTSRPRNNLDSLP